MQAVNMNYLSPAQTYADNNKYPSKSSMNNTMEGKTSEYDSVNFMNKNAYLQKNKPSLNSNYLRLMMETTTNGSGNNVSYDDYHYGENMSFSQLSQPINLSQTSTSIPSPSFSQYQNPTTTMGQHKYRNGLHHNRSNPYEYNMNSGDYTFEEYLREVKIKRSHSDNTSSEYSMNSNSSVNIHHTNYYPPEYSQNTNNNINSHYINNGNYSTYNSSYSQNGSYNYGRFVEEGKQNIRMRSYGDNYDEVMKQKYGYDYNRVKTASSDMNNLCRNMNYAMQDPIGRKGTTDRYGSVNYNSHGDVNGEEPPAKKQVINVNKWNSMYSMRNNSTVSSYTNESMVVPINNMVGSVMDNSAVVSRNSSHPYSSPIKECHHDHDHENDTTLSTIANTTSRTIVAEPEKMRYSPEREEELFLFYINFLRKELYNNIKEMSKKPERSPSVKDSETNSTASTPMNIDGPSVVIAKGNGTIFNNNSISNLNSIPSINNNGESVTNNSSQSSYMTSQSDPYYSPPCSPIDGDNHQTFCKYCIHLVLKNGKIESYILLPSECTLCHHSCHKETVVETVAEIYSNRSCRDCNKYCKYCTDHECCKRCFDFARTHVSNDDIAIDLETVESFMNKFTSESEDSTASSTISDAQTLSGGNCSMSTLNNYSRYSSTSGKLSINPNVSGFSDKRSESCATLAMDQSTSFEKSYSMDAESRIAKSNSSKSSKSTMNETFLKNYNMYGNDTKSTHALKTPGQSIIDSKSSSKMDLNKSNSHRDPSYHSLDMESKPANTSTFSNSSLQEAVANTSTTAKNMAKIMENTSFESRKGYDKYEKHKEYKDDPKTMQRLHRAEESRRKIKERIGYERKILSYLESHGGEVTSPEEIRELTELFGKEFSFYGFILRFSMVFAIICAMFSEHSRHISYNVDSFISISKIVVFVIVKNITPITSCISALILYVRFIETMDYESAADRYKIVRNFSQLVRDDEFGQCVDKIFSEYIERVSTQNKDESGEHMELDDSPKKEEDHASSEFRSKRRINSDLPIFPSSSMNERNRNVVIDSYLLFIICLIISHKYTIDTCEYNYKNKSWYFIYTFFLKDYKNPNMTMKQFNQYEFYILCVLQYNIHISMEEYNNFDVFVKRNCSSFGKDLSLYITTSVLDKLSKAMVNQEYYKKLNSNNYKNYIFNSVINNMESKIRVFFEQVITMVKRNTNDYQQKSNNEFQSLSIKQQASAV
ncbi:hypothetical protein BCR36DRAFT_45735 [Piromyces finnis]|uniref:Uncharacterized protein n=1 Tax=Piromyces finnis TaxID=1754191 RepID=A0A1Y1VAD2_9FUNG|nr:hypothetical protein BCR36DRAFT_45735 [Piromyces finnis]|eukprot:ORX51117.1 hypothetical protein BCR36DRAFT_45735 [Piromyces finnis]